METEALKRFFKIKNVVDDKLQLIVWVNVSKYVVVNSEARAETHVEAKADFEPREQTRTLSNLDDMAMKLSTCV